MPNTGTVIPQGLNLRATPGGTIITVLTQGTTVEILEDQGAFLKVDANGQIGFVASQFIQRGGTAGVRGTVVIDPGHGGTGTIDGSDGDHAVGPVSGVREKNLTLILARLVKSELEAAAAAGGHTINIFMTRNTDVNLGLGDRARVARTNHADRFVSIHMNASDQHTARGVETWIRRPSDNVNFNDDKKFATKIQNAVFAAIRGFDANTRDRGVKDARFGVLNDVSLGNTSGGNCRACLLEVEFLDFPAVDRLLNVGPNHEAVRSGIARAIAAAIIDDLQHP